jgi:hypothetical protein
MDAGDLELRNLTYGAFVEFGRAPTASEVAHRAGIATHVDGRVETSCPDCGEAINEERSDDESLLFHCLVPASRWWDDIVFT